MQANLYTHEALVSRIKSQLRNLICSKQHLCTGTGEGLSNDLHSTWVYFHVFSLFEALGSICGTFGEEKGVLLKLFPGWGRGTCRSCHASTPPLFGAWRCLHRLQNTARKSWDTRTLCQESKIHQILISTWNIAIHVYNHNYISYITIHKR